MDEYEEDDDVDCDFDEDEIDRAIDEAFPEGDSESLEMLNRTKANVKDMVDGRPVEQKEMAEATSQLAENMVDGLLGDVLPRPADARALQIERDALVRTRPLVVGLVETIRAEIARSGDREVHGCVEFRQKTRETLMESALTDVLDKGVTDMLNKPEVGEEARVVLTMLTGQIMATIRKKFEQRIQTWSEHDFQPGSKLSDLASASIWQFNQGVMKMAMKAAPGAIPIEGLLIPHGWQSPGWQR